MELKDLQNYPQILRILNHAHENRMAWIKAWRAALRSPLGRRITMASDVVRDRLFQSQQSPTYALLWSEVYGLGNYYEFRAPIYRAVMALGTWPDCAWMLDANLTTLEAVIQTSEETDDQYWQALLLYPAVLALDKGV